MAARVQTSGGSVPSVEVCLPFLFSLLFTLCFYHSFHMVHKVCFLIIVFYYVSCGSYYLNNCVIR